MKRNNTVLLALVLAVLVLVASVVFGVLLGHEHARQDAQISQKDPTSGEKPQDPQNSQDPQAPSGEQNPAENGEETSDKEGEPRVTFLAAGDVVLHESVFLDANLRAGQSGASGSVNANSLYDFAPMYERVKSAVSAADIAMINQETLIGAASNGIPQGYPGFTGPTAAGDVLSAVGFDVVNIGNNHMLDQGSSGLRRSMEYWSTQSNVSVIGAYASRSECDDVLILEENGIKIAILPYLGQTPGTNGYVADSSLYIPYLNEDLVRTQMEYARENADFVIVTVHWGNEGTYSPNSEQTSYAAMFASLGADALIGTHPHVLQPMQWMDRAGYEKGGKMLLCYSLGDFLSHTQLAGGKNALGNLLGGYVTFDIVMVGDSAVLENARFVPTVSHYDKNSPLDTGFCIYPLSEYTQDLLQRFGDTKAGFTSLSQLEAIVEKNIPEEFLS